MKSYSVRSILGIHVIWRKDEQIHLLRDGVIDVEIPQVVHRHKVAFPEGEGGAGGGVAEELETG